MKKILLLLVLVSAAPAAAQTSVATYPEDTPTVNGERVVMIGLRRCDTTPTSSSGAAGDRSSACVDENGRIYVNASIFDPATGAAIPPSDGGAGAVSTNTTRTVTATDSPDVVALQSFTACNLQAKLEMTTATTTQLLPLAGASKKNHICHIRVQAGGTSTVTFKESATASTCATPTAISEAEELTAQSGYVAGTGIGEVLANDTTNNSVCATSSGAVNVHIFVRYSVF